MVTVPSDSAECSSNTSRTTRSFANDLFNIKEGKTRKIGKTQQGFQDPSTWICKKSI